MFRFLYLEVILIDFVLKKDENYCPWAFLKEWKYIEKEKKVIPYITDDLGISSDGSDEDNSDTEDYKKNMFNSDVFFEGGIYI